MNLGHPLKSAAGLWLLVILASCASYTYHPDTTDKLAIKTRPQLAALAEAGVKHIVNLRPATELEWDEAAHVRSLGMQYHYIPVDGASGITPANATKLAETLEFIGDESVLVHCSSSNRVGALIALDAKLNRGEDIEDAIETGKQWGLTSLEPVVRKQLGD